MTITSSCARTRSAGSTASPPISPDIHERIEAHLAPVMWKPILDTRVLIAEDPGAAPTPLVLAQVQCYTGRSAASRHPSRWRGAATNM
jgi:hypothetical protein